MHDRSRTILNTNQPRQTPTFGAQPNRSRSTPASRPKIRQSAQQSHERYLALARAEALAGNPIGAENFLQHAEHYFRSMHEDAL